MISKPGKTTAIQEKRQEVSKLRNTLGGRNGEQATINEEDSIEQAAGHDSLRLVDASLVQRHMVVNPEDHRPFGGVSRNSHDISYQLPKMRKGSGSAALYVGSLTRTPSKRRSALLTWNDVGTS